MMVDGYIVYQGYACEVANYFARMQQPCPIWQNPADFYIKYLSVQYPLEKHDQDKIE